MAAPRRRVDAVIAARTDRQTTRPGSVIRAASRYARTAGLGGDGPAGQRPDVGSPAAGPDREGGVAPVDLHVPDHHVGQAGLEALPDGGRGGDVVGEVEAPVCPGEDLL